MANWKTSGGRRQSTVSKDNFPTLLNELNDEITKNSSSNIKAGFKKAGIVPLNPNEVLSRLPTVSQPSESETGVAARVSDVFVEQLKELRYGNADEPRNVARRSR
ncbi:MAG: hypothetical protein ABW168_28590 [Sedimenticola sp.]